MKLVYIIGCGMGPGCMTSEANAALSEAQVVIGSPRQTEQFARPNQEVFTAYRKAEVDSIVADSDKSIFALLVSGDTGFYSAASSYGESTRYRIRFVAGISSVSYFFAKCRLPWQDAKLLSSHGRSCGVVEAVRRNKLTFLLTGGNVSDIAAALGDCGFGELKVYVGECLGAPDETVDIMTVNELCRRSCSPLTVIIIENPHCDSRLRVGIPDSEFIRAEGIPMTKSAVRAAIMSALSPSPGDVCWDIGCGTGSVSAELALAAYEGKVYSIDSSAEAAALTVSNCRALHIGNVSVAVGSAPDALESFPVPDKVFIGGSSGRISKLIRCSLSKNPAVRIVATAISPQRATAAIDAMQDAGLSPEITQISSAHGRQRNGMHLMLADNPVYIISGGGVHG